MVIKNLRQLFFLFMENSFAKQHSTDSVSRSVLLLHITVPPATPLTGHVVKVVIDVHEVVEDVLVPQESKFGHDILFQC